ncbi:MAG: proline dehydrogenase family protein [Bacteroidetes bacterium]|nr:proline dehydrogenase family protein [Bacteroidota bacterium]
MNSPISFDNTAIAFASKSNNDLNRAYLLFKVISYNWLVKIAPVFVDTALALRLPVKGLIRATAFKHFCGGENIADCQHTIEALGKYNIGTILDYSVEGKETEDDFEHSLQETLSCIARAKGQKNIPFSVFKLTGFARMALLEKVNAKEPLSKQEEDEFERVKQRVEKICATADEANVPVFIDAEETWVQNVIDDLANAMMIKYNRKRVLVYNTLQLYRTDRNSYLEQCFNHAVTNNYMLGVKLVRGAYMEKERDRAKKMNYPTPIQPDKNAADKDYDDALKFCMDHIDRISICAGTHNEKSSLLLVELMNQKNIPHNHTHIWFSQLYGMSDHISFNLAKEGYNVAKYVPYGPVASVLPYLIRRAQENTSVKGQTGRELANILAEKKRRKKN